jgi:hypothetical protein
VPPTPTVAGSVVPVLTGVRLIWLIVDAIVSEKFGRRDAAGGLRGAAAIGVGEGGRDHSVHADRKRGEGEGADLASAAGRRGRRGWVRPCQRLAGDGRAVALDTHLDGVG